MFASVTDFSGLWIPLITPFKNGQVDHLAAQKLAAFYAANGVAGIIVASATGEGNSLTGQEKAELARSVLTSTRHRCPVVMALRDSGTGDMQAEAGAFANIGINGYLAAAPAGAACTQEAMLVHFRAIAAATDLPVILCSVPARTGASIALDTVAALAESSQFIALNECGGRPVHELATLLANPPCTILCGEDSALYARLLCGVQGAISASAHIRPDLFVKLHILTQEEKYDEARTLFARLLPMIELLSKEPAPILIKAELAAQGWIENELRLPLVAAQDDTHLLGDAVTSLNAMEPIKYAKTHVA